MIRVHEPPSVDGSTLYDDWSDPVGPRSFHDKIPGAPAAAQLGSVVHYKDQLDIFYRTTRGQLAHV